MRHRPESLPDDLAAPLARAAERLGRFGTAVRWYAELASTNDAAAARAEAGAPEGALVLADAQTAGRGRHGRPWCSPPGAGVYASVVLRPHAAAVPFVTIAAGVALAEGIRAATGLATALKWPNDVYVSGRKLAGILAEAAPSHVVLGFGVNLRPAAYPPEIARRATSLEGELGREVDRGVVLVECLAALAAQYERVQAGRCGAVLDAWRVHARPLLGRPVEWDDHGGARRGVAEDVDASGALVVRTDAGPVRVISGEVRWV